MLTSAKEFLPFRYPTPTFFTHCSHFLCVLHSNPVLSIAGPKICNFHCFNQAQTTDSRPAAWRCSACGQPIHSIENALPYQYTSNAGQLAGTLLMLATLPVHFKCWPPYRYTSNAGQLAGTLQMLATLPVHF